MSHYPKQDWGCSFRHAQDFFGRRVNCEGVPILPARVVIRVLDDPRKIPYLLLWTSERDGEVKEAVRVEARDNVPSRFPPFPPHWTGIVEIKRPDEGRNFIRTMLRPLPRNGGRDRLLICPYCDRPRRALYGWEPGGEYTHSAQSCSWKCRACAELRYRSEGTYFPRMFRSLGGYPRQESWYPYVFTDAEEAIRWIHESRGILNEETI